MTFLKRFFNEMQDRYFTATLALSVDLQRDRVGIPLRITHGSVVGAVGTMLWTFFDRLSFSGDHSPDFNPRVEKDCLDIEMSVKKLNLGRPLS
jgi:hypothetical protein